MHDRHEKRKTLSGSRPRPHSLIHTHSHTQPAFRLVHLASLPTNFSTLMRTYLSSSLLFCTQRQIFYSHWTPATITIHCTPILFRLYFISLADANRGTPKEKVSYGKQTTSIIITLLVHVNHFRRKVQSIRTTVWVSIYKLQKIIIIRYTITACLIDTCQTYDSCCSSHLSGFNSLNTYKSLLFLISVKCKRLIHCGLKIYKV